MVKYKDPFATFNQPLQNIDKKIQMFKQNITSYSFNLSELKLKTQNDFMLLIQLLQLMISNGKKFKMIKIQTQASLDAQQPKEQF